jgi:hypothetical protein
MQFGVVSAREIRRSISRTLGCGIVASIGSGSTLPCFRNRRVEMYDFGE